MLDYEKSSMFHVTVKPWVPDFFCIDLPESETWSLVMWPLEMIVKWGKSGADMCWQNHENCGYYNWYTVYACISIKMVKKHMTLAFGND